MKKRIFTAIDEWSVSKSLDGQYYPQRYKYTVIFRILYSTGMRISEVLNLKLENIDFENNTFTILNAKKSFRKNNSNTCKYDEYP